MRYFCGITIILYSNEIWMSGLSDIISKGVDQLMTETFDIISEEGTRVVQCKNDNGKITFHGKWGTLTMQELMAQASNPVLARQRKSALTNKRIMRRRKNTSG